MEAFEGASGTTYDATVVRGLAEGTLLVYKRALLRLRRAAREQPHATPRAILQSRLLESFRKNTSSSNIKSILSAVRLLEKLGWVAEMVTRADWLLVEAMEKHDDKRKKSGEGRTWASAEALVQLSDMAEDFADWEVVALAAISSGLLLRASEACTVKITTPTSDDDLPAAEFWGCKSRRGKNISQVGPWVRGWLQFLQRWRALHGHNPDVPASFTGPTGLHAGLLRLINKGTGQCRGLRWHAFRRFGAAQLHNLGLPLAGVCLYGGWSSHKVAQLYTRAPPSWQFIRAGGLPVPAIEEKTASVTVIESTTLRMFPRWVRREIAWAAQDAASAARRPREHTSRHRRKRARTAEPGLAAASSDDE